MGRKTLSSNSKKRKDHENARKIFQGMGKTQIMRNKATCEKREGNLEEKDKKLD